MQEALRWVIRAIQDYVEVMDPYCQLVAQFMEVIVWRHWHNFNQVTDPICAGRLLRLWSRRLLTRANAREDTTIDGGLWTYIWASGPVGDIPYDESDNYWNEAVYHYEEAAPHTNDGWWGITSEGEAPGSPDHV